MWSICKKELSQFFGSLTGYVAILLFLLLNGLFLFVFPESNIFDFGYATLDKFFEISPWVLLLLIPAITMRSFADEFRAGTYEILLTRPLSHWQIITGKYLSSLIISVMAIVPTLLYVFSVDRLSAGGIDVGGIAGSYIGLFFLAAVFASIGIFCSSLSGNSVVAFLLGAAVCFMVYSAFSALAGLPVMAGGPGYFVDMIGIDSHYRSMSRGVIDTRDVMYFGSMIFLFLYLTAHTLQKR